MTETIDLAAAITPAWRVTNWRCTDHPRESWVWIFPSNDATTRAWMDQDTRWPDAPRYATVEELRAAHPNLIAAQVNNVHALVAAENQYRQLWHASVRASQAKPRDPAKDQAEAMIWAAVDRKVNAAAAKVEAALALHRWLLSLDEPGNTERRQVTLSQIIKRANDFLEQPA